MGNENSASVRICNETEIPLVFVISQVGPLYWGVLQPGERAVRVTGRVWFTITTYPYDGSNEPKNADAVLSILIPSAAALAVVLTAGAATVAAIPAAGTAQAALAPLVAGPYVAGIVGGINATGVAINTASGAIALKDKLFSEVQRCCNSVTKTGHYANGDWIHVRGGPKKHGEWIPMKFES